MNKSNILQEILKNKDLKEKYWPDEDIEKYNPENILMSGNKYIKSIYYVFSESNRSKFTSMINGN
jgi:hypothetical protein